MVNNYKNIFVSHKIQIFIFIILIFIFLILFFTQFNKKSIDNQILTELNILNWDDYTATPELIEIFENESNIKINIDTYEFTEQIFEFNLSKYDLILVSESQISELIELKVISKLNSRLLPNTKFISPECKLSSPNSEYFIPYVWGTTGVIVNEDLIPNHKNSWDILWSEFYKNKTMMIQSPEEIIVANSMNVLSKPYPEDNIELNNVLNFIVYQSNNLFGYYTDLDEVSELFEDESIWAIQAYSGDLINIETTKNLKYFIPSEGTAKWIDGFVIPSSSKNKKLAHSFANFLLEKQNNAEIAEYYEVPTCNENSKLYLSNDFLSDDSIYPNSNVKDKLKFVSDYEMFSELNNLYDNLFEEINIK
jgi:spermidine/putrescine transport system substrate-binding protein